MNAPKSIKIGSITYQVKVMPARDLWAASGVDLLGQSKFIEAELQVREGMPDDRSAQVLLHEAIHAIEETGGLDLDEKTVSAIGSGVFALLRDNPELTTYLMQAGNEPPV